MCLTYVYMFTMPDAHKVLSEAINAKTECVQHYSAYKLAEKTGGAFNYFLDFNDCQPYRVTWG